MMAEAYRPCLTIQGYPPLFGQFSRVPKVAAVAEASEQNASAITTLRVDKVLVLSIYIVAVTYSDTELPVRLKKADNRIQFAMPLR